MLKFFKTKKEPHKTTHLVIATVYGSSLQKQRSTVQAAPQFKDADISIQLLNPSDLLIGLKRQQPVLLDQLSEKLFIMYPASIPVSKQEDIYLQAQKKATQVVTCLPTKAISCLKVSVKDEPNFYLVRLEDIKAIQPENSSKSDVVSTRLVR